MPSLLCNGLRLMVKHDFLLLKVLILDFRIEALLCQWSLILE